MSVKQKVVCFVHFDGLGRLGRQQNDVNSTYATVDHSHVPVCLLKQNLGIQILNRMGGTQERVKSDSPIHKFRV